MDGYHGYLAGAYSQSKWKKFSLIPVIKKYLGRARRRPSLLLDLACGHGDFYPLARASGYTYVGLDRSQDMIAEARRLHPDGDFRIASATKIPKRHKKKFDVILISMLFPCFGRRSDITATLIGCRRILARGGKIIVGTTHPCFDHYMQRYLFRRRDVNCEFVSYFASGAPFRTSPQRLGGKWVTFDDYHWTFADYVKSIDEAGLRLSVVDECRPRGPAPAMGNKAHIFAQIPIYCVFVCSVDGQRNH